MQTRRAADFHGEPPRVNFSRDPPGIFPRGLTPFAAGRGKGRAFRDLSGEVQSRSRVARLYFFYTALIRSYAVHSDFIIRRA